MTGKIAWLCSILLYFKEQVGFQAPDISEINLRLPEDFNAYTQLKATGD